ncbi:MAG: molybdopterin-dependent oxidoreductase, partial [Chloroflexi bacterium]|nr:molybdopterin-dependent oxidoreductase [Chloroflexota bacterium]
MADMVTLKINGQTVTVPRGTYILKAAQMAGIDVPNFCYQQELRPWGSCRICTVEILGRRGGLIESCATPVREGMEVATHSPACMDARQEILRLYLIDHALDCAICDASGECFLQDYTYEHGVDANPYRRPKRKSPTLHFSDLIDYNWDRCIMCARCTRVCDEVIGATALSFTSRGLESEIAPAFGDSLYTTPCTHCGMCIQVCPVGALTDRWYGNHPWRVAKTQTTCSLCAVGCTLEVWREDQDLVKVQGPWETGVNQGWTCVKGRWGHDFVKDETRLTRPLLRRGGRLEPAPWTEALDIVAERLATKQGEGFAGLISAKATNEEVYVFQQFVRAVMGSNTVESPARRTHAATLRAMATAFGSAAATNPQRELLDTGCILLIGSNMAEAQPVMSYNIVRAVKGRDACLIVINPTKPTILGDLATIWLAPRPGTDALLLSAMAKVILDDGLADEAFIDARTEGFAAWKLSVSDLSLEGASAATGVPAGDIAAAARLYARGGLTASARPERGWPAATLAFGTGLTQQPNGEANVQAACNLALLTGNVGRRLGGVTPLHLDANEQGAVDMGALSDRLPGGAAVTDAAARTALADRWLPRWGEPAAGATRIESLPAAPGRALSDLWSAIGAGEVTALYVVGDDPALLDPGAAAALAQLDLLIVQDTFLSETARLAHVVLPGTTAVEKDGSFTSNDRIIQRVRAVLAPVGQSRADDEIIRSIARRLGYQMPHRASSEVMDEIAQVAPDYRGVNQDRLEQGGLPWPVADTQFPGTPMLHVERFATASGRAAFTTVDVTTLLAPAGAFPLALALGDSLFQPPGGAVGRASTNLSRLEGGARVEVNPADALGLGLAEGDPVDVVTEHGRLRAWAMLTTGVTPGRLFIDAQWSGASSALLTAPPGEPARKVTAARLEPAPGAALDSARL